MRLKGLQIEGFRGINQPVVIPLDENMVVISGPNGAGKTSIFEAIEWCLFGQLDFGGVEFQREDALVNDFHPRAEARVTLTLDDDTMITRSRTKKAKTGFQKHDSLLTVIRSCTEVSSEEAQNVLDNLLALNADEFGVVVHLRQETIRNFIQGTPAERSKTIDKMIGLLHLRELISGLDPKAVDKEIKQLEQRVADIERTMIQATILTREGVKEQEDALERTGIPREQISATKVVTDFEEISGELVELAKNLGVSAPVLDPLSPGTARQTLSQVKKAARALGETRFTRYSQIEQTISQLTQLYGELERAARDLDALAGTDVNTMIAQREAAVTRKGEFQEKLARLNSRASELNQLQRQVVGLETALQQTQTRLQALGTIADAEARLKKIRSEMEVVVAAGKTERPLERLLPAAAEYLKIAQPHRCPVCLQTIADLQAVIHRLEQDAQASEQAQRIKKLEDQWNELKEAERKQERLIKESQETEETLTRQRKELGDLKAELTNVATVPISEPLADFMKKHITAMTAEIASVQQEISGTEIAIATISGQLRVLEEKQVNLRACRQRVVKALGIPADTENLSFPLQERIKLHQRHLDELKKLADAFPRMDGATDRIERVLGVLEARERLARLEREYPTAVKEKTAIKRTIEKLNDLKLGLQDIYQAATEHQRSVVGGALAALEPVINAHYSQILGHPEYAELQLQPEEERTGVYHYWIAARNPAGTHSTYVVTRFSASQRNVAAVAIFLAMADQLPHNLNVLMMDDPSQSMDLAHTQAMAQFLAEEAKDKQVIIATEDTVFAEMILKAYENPLHYALKPWTTEGVAFGGPAT